MVENYLYRKNRGKYWRCLRCTKYQCKARLIFNANKGVKVIGTHTHGHEREKIDWGRQIFSALKTRYKDELGLKSKIKLSIRHPHFKTDMSDYICKYENESSTDEINDLSSLNL